MDDRKIDVQITADLSGLRKAAPEVKKELEGIGEAGTQAGRGLDSAADAANGLGDAGADLAGTLGEIGDALNGDADAASNLAGQALRAGAAAGVLGGAIAAGAVAVAGYGVAKLAAARATADLAREQSELADISGLTTQRIVGLAYAAERVNVSGADLAEGIGALQARAATGGEEFARLGVATRDASGQLRDAEAVFDDVVRALAGVSSETERSEIAQRLFGRSSQDVMQVLAQGTAALDAHAKEAASLGLVLSTDTIEATRQLDAETARFEMTLKGLSAEIGSGTVRTLANLKKAFNDAYIAARGEGWGVGLGIAAGLGNMVFGDETVFQSNEDRKKQLIAQIAEVEDRVRNAMDGGETDGAARLTVGLQRLKRELDALSTQGSFELPNLKAQFEQQQQAAVEGLNAYVGARRTQSQQLQADLAAETAAFQQAVARFSPSSEEYTRALAAHEEKKRQIQEKYAKEGRSSANEVEREAQALERLRNQLAGLDAGYSEQLSSLSKAYASGRMSVDEYRAAVEALIARQPFAREQAKKTEDAEKAATKAREEAKKIAEAQAKAIASMVDAEARRAASLDEATERAREEIETLGMGAEALSAYRVEKLQAAAAADEHAAAQLDEAAAALELRGELPQVAAEYRRLAAEKRKAAEAGRQAAGLETERGAAEAAKKTRDEWKRTGDSIEQSLTDALMRGFESGEGFGENLKQTLENMFRTLVLRPIISPIAQAGSNLVNGLIGMGADALGLGGLYRGATGGGSGGGVLDAAQNLYSLYNNAGTAWDTVVSGYGWLTGAGAANMAGFSTATGFGAAAPTLGSGLTYGSSIPAGYLSPTYTSSATTAAAGSSSSGIGAAAGYAAVAAIAVAWISAIFDEMARPDPRASYMMASSDSDGSRPWESWEDGVYVDGAFGRIGMHSYSKDIKAYDPAYLQQFQSLANQDNLLASFLNDAEVEAVQKRMDGWISAHEDRRDSVGALNARLLAIAEGIGGEQYDDIWNWYYDAEEAAITAFIEKRLGGFAVGVEGQGERLKAAVDQYVRSQGNDYSALAELYTELVDRNTTSETVQTDYTLDSVISELNRTFDLGLNRGQHTSTQDLYKYILDRIRVDDLQSGLDKVGQSIGKEGALAWMQEATTTQKVKNEYGVEVDQEVDGYTNLAANLNQIWATLYATPVDMVNGQLDALRETMKAFGTDEIPSNVIALRELAEGIDLSTEAGRALYMTLKDVAPAVLAMQESVLGLAGLDRAGLVGTISAGLSGNSTADEVAASLNSAVLGGIRTAMTAEVSGMVADLMIGQIINPAIEAMVLGGELSQAINAEQIDAAIAQIEQRASALEAVFSSDAVQQSLASLQDAMSSIGATVGRVGAALNTTAAAAKAVEDAARAAEEAQRKYEAGVKSAEDALRAAYQREADELQSTIDRFDDFARSLREFREGLLLGEESPLSLSERQAEADRQFTNVSTRARLGDIEAIEQLQGISSAYLDATRSTAGSAEDYYRAFARVQGALVDTEGVAGRQADIAREQLDALTTQVGALITINDSVLSVADAIKGLQAAQSGFVSDGNGGYKLPSSIVVVADDSFGAAMREANDRLAGTWAQVWQAVEAGNAAAEAAARAAYEAATAARDALDRYDGTTWSGRAYATGGVFTNGVVTRPTYFNESLMGEASAEAIMPLTNIGGSLGVRAVLPAADASMLGELRALRASNEALRAELAEMRSVAVATARHTAQTASTLDRVTRGGVAMQTEIAA